MNACDQFDDLLPDWLEGTLSLDRRGAAGDHLATCARCRALADDLSAITHAAAALPPIEPARDLWSGIAQRIEAPVVPLNVTAERAIATRRLVVSRRWLSAAAAALVVASVSGTYAVMRVTGGGGSTTVVATPRATAPTTRTAVAPTTGPAAPMPGVTSVATSSPNEATPAPERGVRLARREDDVAPGVTTYDAEIRSLRTLLRRRTDLDSSTVAVIAKSLRVIDDAIAQSRSALARDPHSRLLGDQLTRALDQKVELLRTAILLPASS